jgi:hypothetical protein
MCASAARGIRKRSTSGRESKVADATIELLKAQLRLLRLPTVGREFEKLARDAAAGNQNY